MSNEDLLTVIENLADEIVKNCRALRSGMTVVVPPVPPVVVPELKPSSILNMKRIGDVYRSDGWLTVPSPQVKIAAVQFSRPDITYGAKVTVKFMRRGNYPLIGNLKPFRVWREGSPQYPNFYLGRQVDKSYMLYSENLEPITGATRFYCSFPTVTEEFREEIYEWTVNSGPGKSDGEIIITIGGQTILDKRGVKFDGAPSLGVATRISIQENVSNGTLPVGSYVEFKKIFITVDGK